ncbi:uncharacterized protein LOC144933354 [Lampetra fluviatilis]
MRCNGSRCSGPMATCENDTEVCRNATPDWEERCSADTEDSGTTEDVAIAGHGAQHGSAESLELVWSECNGENGFACQTPDHGLDGSDGVTSSPRCGLQQRGGPDVDPASGGESDHYVTQLRDAFDACDRGGSGRLDHAALEELATWLQLDADLHLPLLLQKLLGDEPSATVNFEAFKKGFVWLLSEGPALAECCESQTDGELDATTPSQDDGLTADQVDESGVSSLRTDQDEAEERSEVEPKLVRGGKRYGRRSRPENSLSEQWNGDGASLGHGDGGSAGNGDEADGSSGGSDPTGDPFSPILHNGRPDVYEGGVFGPSEDTFEAEGQNPWHSSAFLSSSGVLDADPPDALGSIEERLLADLGLEPGARLDPQEAAAVCTQLQLQHEWQAVQAQLEPADDGTVSCSELLQLLQHSGVDEEGEAEPEERREEEEEDLDDERTSLSSQNLSLGRYTPSLSPPPPGVLRQLKRFHYSQEEGGRRTATPSLLAPSGHELLFSDLDDGTGSVPTERLLDSWLADGVAQPHTILEARRAAAEPAEMVAGRVHSHLVIECERVCRADLTAAIDAEMLSSGDGLPRVTLLAYKAEVRTQSTAVCGPSSLLFTANMMFDFFGRRSQAEQASVEREKLRVDLERTERRCSKLANETDERHDQLESLNSSRISELEQDCREKVAATRTEMDKERELIMSHVNRQREKLEAEIDNLRKDEAELRDRLGITMKENSRLERELSDLAERLADSEKQVCSLKEQLHRALHGGVSRCASSHRSPSPNELSDTTWHHPAYRYGQISRIAITKVQISGWILNAVSESAWPPRFKMTGWPRACTPSAQGDDLDPTSAEFLAREERFAHVLREHEQRCREMQDRIDELQSEVELLRTRALPRKGGRLNGERMSPEGGEELGQEDARSMSASSIGSTGSLRSRIRRKLPDLMRKGVRSPEAASPGLSIEAELVLENLKEQHQQEVFRLTEALTSKEEEFDTKLEQTRAEAERRARDAEDRLEAKVADARARHSALEVQVASLRELVEEARAQRDEALARLNEKRAEAEEKARLLDALSKEHVQQLEKKVEEGRQKAFKSNEQAVQRLRVALSDKEQEVGRVSARLREAEKESGDLQSQLSAKDEEVTSIKRKLEEVEREKGRILSTTEADIEKIHNKLQANGVDRAKDYEAEKLQMQAMLKRQKLEMEKKLQMEKAEVEQHFALQVSELARQLGEERERMQRELTDRHQAEMAQQRKTVEQLNKENLDAKKIMESLNQQVLDRSAEVDTLHLDNGNLTSQCRSLQAELEALSRQVTSKDQQPSHPQGLDALVTTGQNQTEAYARLEEPTSHISSGLPHHPSQKEMVARQPDRAESSPCLEGPTEHVSSGLPHHPRQNETISEQSGLVEASPYMDGPSQNGARPCHPSGHDAITKQREQAEASHRLEAEQQRQKEAEAHIARLEATVEAAELKVRLLEEERRTLKRDLAASKDKAFYRAAEDVSQLSTLAKDRDLLQEERDVLSRELDAYRTQVTRLSHVEREVGSLRENKQKLEQHSQAMSEHLHQSSEKLKSLDTSLLSATAQTAALQSDLRLAQQEREALRQEVMSLTRALQLTRDKAYALECSAQAASDTSQQKQLFREGVTRLTERELREQRSENDHLAHEAQLARAELAHARDKVSQLEMAMASLQQNGHMAHARLLQLSEQEVLSLRGRVDALQAQLRAHQEKVKQMGEVEVELQQARAESSRLREENAQMQERLSNSLRQAQSHVPLARLEEVRQRLAEEEQRVRHLESELEHGRSAGSTAEQQEAYERMLKSMGSRMEEVEGKLKSVRVMLQEKVTQLREQLNRNEQADMRIKDLYVENSKLMKDLQLMEQRQRTAERKSFLLEEKVVALNKLLRKLVPEPLQPML